MNNISKNVLNKIKKEKIKPIPQWQFILLHIAVWIGLIASIILGSLAVGIVLREFFGTDWDQVHRIGKSGIPGVVFVLPYVWFIAIGLTFFLSSILVKHIKKGYKLNPWLITLGSILISILLGSIMYATKASDQFEQTVRNNIAPYKALKDAQDRFWMAPEKGIIIGRIVSVKNTDVILVNDATGQRWEIDIKEAILPKNFSPAPNEGIMAIGEIVKEYIFKANEIRNKKRVPLIKPMPRRKTQNGF